MRIRILEVLVFCCVLVSRVHAQTPVIISQPQSATNNMASAADFTVTATNAATYQWQFDGTNIAGATTTLLSLDDLTTNQAGSYTVIVSSSNHVAVTSAPPAVLTIVPGTIIQWTISTFPDGSSSNFMVQLFDHDKPATVENFIHYITSGAYSNMWFDRLVPNFVLQGGHYASADRTTNSLVINAISKGTNLFPAQVDNEFSVGPLIHNRFGTVAMALSPGNTNSATSQFYFNLVDNSASLDVQDFTVFGRILSGTNILRYFNTLSAPSAGLYTNNQTVPTIPVNYDGTQAPNRSSLFYCDFAFLSPPTVDTNPPTVAITFPASNEVFTNLGDLTILGTASDDVSVAEVYCVLTALTGVFQGESATNAVVGTASWSLDFGSNAPGVYQLQVYAQDGAGNLSAPATVNFTNLTTITIITNINGQLTTNQQYIVPGQPFSATAAQIEGSQFLDWQIQGVISLDPEQDFTAETNITLKATYVLTNLPAGLAITSPIAGSVVIATNAQLTISGTLPASLSGPEVTVQLFLQSNAVTAALPATINGTSWSLTVGDLTGGSYTIVAVGGDASGDQGLASENLTIKAPPIIFSQPASVTNLSGSTAYFSVTASNAVSYQWSETGIGPITGATNATLALTNVGTNLSGTSYFVDMTSADGETNITSPAVLTVVTGTLVQITFSGFPDGSSSNVIVQLFDHEKPATVANFLHYITPVNLLNFFTNVAYSNMIWDRCLPGFVLQGGDYSATPTDTTQPPNIESINYNFTQDTSYSPSFPSRLDNEFAVGPVIHNTFGTLAMAKNPGDPDSAANGFFFNLADNSTNLDTQNGGYTVFGHLISGSNVLQYFNTLSKPAGGIFDETTASTNGLLTDLPVNNHNWLVPSDTNLFYASFKLLSAYNPDTTPPTVTMNYPTNGQTVTNAHIVFQGTASDDVAVGRVSCTFNDTFGFNGGSGTVNAIGTTNWSADFLSLPPGNYTYNVAAQDGAGNIAASAKGSFTVPRFPFQSATNGNGTLSTNLDGTNTTVGSTYTIAAKPAKGSIFLNWSTGTNSFLSPTFKFAMQNGMQLTANFLTNPQPGGISVSFPAANASITNASVRISGRLAANFGSAQVSCQVFSSSSGESLSVPMLFNATNSWTAPAFSLKPGDYIVQAIAYGADNRADAVTQHFTVLAKLTVTNYGLGHVSIPNGKYLRVGSINTIVATPAPGYSFLSWNAGGGTVPARSIQFPMSEGLSLTATFVPNSLPGKLTITTPVYGSQVLNTNMSMGGRIAASVASPQVICQLFQNNTPVTGFLQAQVTGTSWSLPFTNLPIGQYYATALVFDGTGKTGMATDLFFVNYYPNIAGTYNGLFYDPASISGTNAGSVSLILSYSGVVYGKLVFPQKTFELYFSMGSTGSITLASPGFTVPITLNLNFDLATFSGVMTGYVKQGNEVCSLLGYRALTKLNTNTLPAPGNYVLSLQPGTNSDDGPPGDGFAALTATATGALRVAGTLADNTPFSLSTGVYTNGVWPLFASFDKGNGMLIGWETNLPSGACAGTLFWVKSPTNGVYYTNGINEQLNSTGAKYVKPAPGVQYQIVFAGGSLAAPVTNNFSFNAAGAIVPASGTADELKGSLLSAGVFSRGSILNPSKNAATLPFSGAFINPQQGGAGFTLDTHAQTGSFIISPVVVANPIGPEPADE